MAKKILINATHAEETRVAVVDGNRLDDFDFETVNRRQISGNIYLARVTRVEPSLQAAFIEYGGNRHGFLAFAEIHPDYYQIPKEDRDALLAAEAAEDAAADEEADEQPKKNRRRKRSRDEGKGRRAPVAEVAAASDDEAVSADEGWDDEPAAPAQVASAEPGDAMDVSGDAPESGDDTDGDDQPPRELAEDVGTEATETLSADLDEEASEPDNGDEDGEEEDDVAETGGSDAREEMAPRRARMRHYKIQDVIKRRQVLLVQVVKEERGSKGAALTTYISLAGRYCVLMPDTARGGGISRKITNGADRKRLKELTQELDVPQGMGLIVRTAGAERTKAEIHRDYEYLLRQWEAVRNLALKSYAPTLIYEEGSLVKRSIRDLYGKDVDQVIVEGEEAYREARDFMTMLTPEHARNVVPYRDPVPLFSRHQIESQLNNLFNPVVQLKSGGYIVIGVTEALVAIDVNSGRSTKEHSIEETALKTNLEAADEAARQIKLRDLAGLIVIDFIDMEESRNDRAVEKRLAEKLKDDRARIQMGRISSFGLLEMSRQRLRPGMLEATTIQCPHCRGLGHVRSEESLALQVLRSIEEEAARGRCTGLDVTVPVSVANYLLNQKRRHLMEIEEGCNLDILIHGDPAVLSPDFHIEKRKDEAARDVTVRNTIRIDTVLERQEVTAPVVEVVETVAETVSTEEANNRKRRRRRRRNGREDRAVDGAVDVAADEDSAEGDAAGSDATEADDAEGDNTSEQKAKRKRNRRGGRNRRRNGTDGAVTDGAVADGTEEVTAEGSAPEASTNAEDVTTSEDVAAPARRRRRKPSGEAASEATVTDDTTEPATEASAGTRRRAPRRKPASEVAAAPETDETAAPAPETPVVAEAVALEPATSAPANTEVASREHAAAPAESAAEAAPIVGTMSFAPEKVEDPNKPRRRGWWSLGRG